MIKTVADIAARDYKIAREKYDTGLLTYKQITRSSPTDTLEIFLADSVKTSTAVAQALQSTLNFLDAAIDQAKQNNQTLSASVNTLRTSAQGYLSTTNDVLNNLLAQQKSIDTIKKTIRVYERNIAILKIGNPNGDNPINLQSSSYNIADQERKIADLKIALADYTVTAPFSGVLASVGIKRYSSVSSGTEVATLITNQKLATLSINEVDVSKIKVGNKATLTFDAIEDLSLTGSVVEVDTVGTVSQGVVSYKIKIALDTNEDSVKACMTLNATIIYDTRQDTLFVPSSAVKTQNGTNYAQVFDAPISETGGSQGVVSDVLPRQVPVTIGISDDSKVEILSGVEEGQQIVVRTVSGVTANQVPATTPSLFGGGRGGGGRGGGGFGGIPGGGEIGH